MVDQTPSNADHVAVKKFVTMSTLFLSFGPTSGLLTGQVLNNLVECVDTPPTWYNESARTLEPNVVFFDSAKSVRLYSDPELPDPSALGQRVERVDLSPDLPITIPRHRPTPFVEYIKSGGQTLIPLDQPRPNFHLEAVDLVWSDIVNFNLSRRLFHQIPGTDIEPLLTYTSGFERAADPPIYDAMTESIRRSLETMDRVSSLSIAIDRNYGFGGVYAKVAEYLAEETPKATQFSFSVADDVTTEEMACNVCFSLSSALQFSSMHTVLTLPESLPPIIDPTIFSGLNAYQKTALLAIPLTSVLLPVLHRATTARAILDVVAPTSILKFTSLEAAFPYYDPIVDFSFHAEERIFSRFAITNGVPTDAAGKLEQSLRPGSPFFYGAVSQRNPCFVGLTMPHFFRSNVTTNTGDRPTVKPAGLSDPDFERLVSCRVLKWRPPVECALIRTLSTAATISTARSLAAPLRNTADFFRNAVRITKTVAYDDAQAAAEVVMNIVDGLEADQ